MREEDALQSDAFRALALSLYKARHTTTTCELGCWDHTSDKKQDAVLAG